MPTHSSFLNNYTLEGKRLQVVIYPDPILKKTAVQVTSFDASLAELAKNMLYTMYKTPGVGLAAPQVNKSTRMFVMDIDYDREEITSIEGKSEYKLSNFNPLVFINPIIKQKEGEFLYEEGCLSVPGVYEEVQRAKHIGLEYFDLDGNKQELEATDLLSVCIQHENDHLDGIIFLERLSMLKKNILSKKYLKNRKKECENV